MSSLKKGIAVLGLFFCFSSALAQSGAICPQNIGFEKGTFANCKSFSGFVSVKKADNGSFLAYSLNETSPIPNQHEIVSRGRVGGF